MLWEYWGTVEITVEESSKEGGQQKQVTNWMAGGGDKQSAEEMQP